MFWHLMILVVVPIGFATAAELWARRARRVFLKGPCAGIRWHRRFPNAPHHDIRAFLKLFSHAYGFKDHQICIVSPDDRIVDIDRAVDPFPMDAIELEEFAEEYLQRYGLDLASAWREDITLGEVFELTRATP